MVADHAEEGPATAVGERLGEDHMVGVGCAGIVAGVAVDHTAVAVVGRPEEHSWGDSFEVPTAGVEEAAVDHVEGRSEDHVVGGHADDCSATEDLRNRLADHPEGQDLVELGGLCMGCGGRRVQADLDLEEDPVVAGLGRVVDHCNHLYVGRVQAHESHRVHLDWHLCCLE